MPLSLTQSATAVAPNCPASFLGVGGTAPYVYSVASGGAGGSVNATTGQYTAPAAASSVIARAYDSILVTDAAHATATARILVGSALLLFCEVIQKELGLAPGRAYLWDQKISQPTDSGLYIAVSVPSCRPFANVSHPLPNGDTEQFVSMQAKVDLDIISRGPEARDRKEEVVLAFNSVYAQQQQEANSFYIGKLPPGSGFINLSEIDGTAIPYRYRISVNLQYEVSKTKPTPYFDTFQNPPETTINELDD